MIESHRESGDEQNQRISGAARIEPRRIGAIGFGQVEHGEVGKRPEPSNKKSLTREKNERSKMPNCHEICCLLSFVIHKANLHDTKTV